MVEGGPIRPSQLRATVGDFAANNISTTRSAQARTSALIKTTDDLEMTVAKVRCLTAAMHTVLTKTRVAIQKLALLPDYSVPVYWRTTICESIRQFAPLVQTVLLDASNP